MNPFFGELSSYFQRYPASDDKYTTAFCFKTCCVAENNLLDRHFNDDNNVLRQLITLFESFFKAFKHFFTRSAVKCAGSSLLRTPKATIFFVFSQRKLYTGQFYSYNCWIGIKMTNHNILGIFVQSCFILWHHIVFIHL